MLPGEFRRRPGVDDSNTPGLCDGADAAFQEFFGNIGCRVLVENIRSEALDRIFSDPMPKNRSPDFPRVPHRG